MIVLSVLLFATAAVLLLPAVSDAISLLVAARSRRTRGAAPASRAPARLLFLVPAHDEELLIKSCVRSLLAQRYPRDRITVLVLADNCSDRTAELAHAAGAHTLVRHDPRRPGKPVALAWAIERVALAEYDAVVIVDADCVVDPGFAAALSARGPLADKAAQPYNDVANPDASPLTRLARLFAVARYRFAYPLKAAAGLAVPLSAGMCLGTEWLREHGWRAFSLSEDWELYALLTRRGIPIDFAPAAHLYAQETSTLRQSASQRTRWTAGKLAVLRHQGGAVVRERQVAWRQKLDAVAELTAPGPALHLGLAACLAAAALTLRVAGAPAGAALLGAGLVRPLGYSAAAVAVDGHPGRSLRSLLHLPLYAVWRLGVALRLVATAVGRPAWVRTAREGAGRDASVPTAPPT